MMRMSHNIVGHHAVHEALPATVRHFSALTMCGMCVGGGTLRDRYGTSWQRVLDMNPQLAGGCQEKVRAGVVVGTDCQLMPGDQVCVLPCL